MSKRLKCVICGEEFGTDQDEEIIQKDPEFYDDAKPVCAWCIAKAMEDFGVVFVNPSNPPPFKVR